MEPNHIVLQRGCLDIAMMFFYYGFRDRKAYAEAAPVRPRFVRTIKPVKQPVKLHASYSHVRIINQDDGVFPSPESYSYHSIRIAVLYSIIQQDRNKLPHSRFISVIADMVRNICQKSFPLAVNMLCKCRYGIQNDFAE